MELILKNVRLSFPDLFKRGLPPKDKPNEPGKYGAQFIFPQNHEAFEAVRKIMMAEAQSKFGPNWQAIVAGLQKDKKCLREGNQNLDKAGEIRDGYRDMFYVVAKNKLQPKIIDRDLSVLTEAAGRPYGGCYVNAKIDIYAMDGTSKGFGRSINASLLAVQFHADGEAFGGAMPNAEGFEATEVADPFTAGGATEGAVKDPLFG